MPTRRHRIFRGVWWSSNALLAIAFLAMLYSGVREYSVRRYLNGFSDAIASATVFFLLLRVLLAWYADSRLRIPRFHLREHAIRAGATFFSAPGIKQ